MELLLCMTVHSMRLCGSFTWRPLGVSAVELLLHVGLICWSLTLQVNLVADNQTTMANETSLSVGSKFRQAARQLPRDNATAPLIPYKPDTLSTALSTAMQSVSDAAKTAHRLGDTAGGNAMVAVKHTARRTAFNALVVCHAVSKFSQTVSNNTCSFGHSTSIALYNGLQHTSASFLQRLGVVQHAVGKAGHATAMLLKSFGEDAAEVSQKMVQGAPALVRKQQQDVALAVEGASHAFKHAGHAVGQQLSHATHKVSNLPVVYSAAASVNFRFLLQHCRGCSFHHLLSSPADVCQITAVF